MPRKDKDNNSSRLAKLQSKKSNQKQRYNQRTIRIKQELMNKKNIKTDF